MVTILFRPPWWRHQMETFSVTLALCQGNSPITREFPSQRSVTRSFDVFFDLHLNKRLSKQLRRRWFETPSHSLWRHRNGYIDEPDRRQVTRTTIDTCGFSYLSYNGVGGISDLTHITTHMTGLSIMFQVSVHGPGDFHRICKTFANINCYLFISTAD